MKYLGLILVITTVISCANHDTPDLTYKKVAESEILNNLKDQKIAWNSGNIPSFMEHYWKSDSMAFMSKAAIRYGWQETLDAYLKNYPTQKEMGELRFKVKKLDIVSPDAAYMLGSWDLERDSLDAGGHFSLIWKKVDEKWVIVTDHTS